VCPLDPTGTLGGYHPGYRQRCIANVFSYLVVFGPILIRDIVVSQEFLHIVSLPPAATSRSSVVDLVFVHGLNPKGSANHAYDTWTHSNGTCWPKILSQDMPWARIMIFGYNSSVAFNAGTGTVRTHADSLLDRLESVRQDQVSRAFSFYYVWNGTADTITIACPRCDSICRVLFVLFIIALFMVGVSQTINNLQLKHNFISLSNYYRTKWTGRSSSSLILLVDLSLNR
jgi:hypothetical protein